MDCGHRGPKSSNGLCPKCVREARSRGGSNGSVEGKRRGGQKGGRAGSHAAKVRAGRLGGMSGAPASKVAAGRAGGQAAVGSVKRAAQKKGLKVRRKVLKVRRRVSLHLRRRPLEAVKILKPSDLPVFLDLFSGKGGLARAIADWGGCALQWDIKHGEEYDLTSNENVEKICHWIRSKKVWGIHIAMLCKSWSRARRGGLAPPLRSDDRPWGLPFLNPVDRAKVVMGNHLLKNSLQIMRVASTKGLPGGFENPQTSRCFQIRTMKSFSATVQLTWFDMLAS